MRSPKTGELSLSRVLGALCIATACFVAVVGILYDREHSGVVTALAIGAGVALITRDRAPEAPEEPLSDA
jgi:Na+/proline symporter